MLAKANDVLLYLGQVEQAKTQSDFKPVQIIHSERYGFVTKAELDKREIIERQNEKLRLMKENSNELVRSKMTPPLPARDMKSLSLSKANRKV